MGIGLELHRTGTVTYVPIGEGFYGIVSDNEDSYKNLYPIHLLNYVDGTKVSFSATTREDYYSVLSSDILQWGVPVEIISINSVEKSVIPSESGILSSSWYKNPWLWAGIGGFILLSSGHGKKVRNKK